MTIKNIMLGMALFSFVFLIVPQTTNAAWWNNDWSHRQAIVIQNTNSTHDMVAGQVVDVVVNTTGDNFLNNGTDFRILYTDDGNATWSSLPYYNFNTFNNVTSHIFFKLNNTISASTTNDSAYFIYHGNDGATNPGFTGYQIFDIFDDFDTDINTTVWGTINEADWVSGYVHIDYDTMTGARDFRTSTIISNMTTALVKWSMDESVNTVYGPRWHFFGDTATCSQVRYGVDNNRITFWPTPIYDHTYTMNQLTWYYSKLNRGGANVNNEMWIEWTKQVENGTDLCVQDNTTLGWGAGEDVDHNINVDTVGTFSYFYPEPTVTLGLSELSGEISSCSVLSSDNTTYLMDANISGIDQDYCINISANGVTFDCQGYSLIGNGSVSYGITTEGTQDVIIKNCVVQDFVGCIEINASDNITVQNVNTYDCGSGSAAISMSATNNSVIDDLVSNAFDGSSANYIIDFDDSYYNLVKDSVLTEAVRAGIRMRSTSNYNTIQDTYLVDSSHYDVEFQLDECSHNFTNVTGTGNYPVYYYNSSTVLQNEQVAQIIMCNADNSYLKNITINGYDAGTNFHRNHIYARLTDNSIFQDINVTRGYNGIVFTNSHNNTINDSYYSLMRYEHIELNVADNNSIYYNTFNYNDVNTGSRASSAIGLYTLSDSNYIYNNHFINGESLADEPVVYVFGTLSTNYFNVTNRTGTRITSLIAKLSAIRLQFVPEQVKSFVTL